jgi:1-acyl-sn-glycerol-3-phosphate acyltransferase
LEFLPAQESALFTRLFGVYTKLLFRRRFKHVWLRQEYTPGPQDKTIYYLNHNSWWDGLIPLLLNRYRLHQNGRALMEDRQLKKYPMFRWLGTFSVNRNDPRKVITSLRYAVQSMQRDCASLYLYPEGKIKPAGTKLVFEGGLAWLHSKVADAVDFVPIGIYMHTLRFDKPELHLHIGKPVRPGPDLSNREKSEVFEQELENLLAGLKIYAGFEDSGFERLL